MARLANFRERLAAFAQELGFEADQLCVELRERDEQIACLTRALFAAREIEREACALVAEGFGQGEFADELTFRAARDIALAIRTRMDNPSKTGKHSKSILGAVK